MKIPNVAASVRARLLTKARARDESLDYLMNRYASERLLFRLSVSPQRDRFILKGATLFALWLETPHRPTRDLDLLGYGEPSIEAIEAVFRAIAATQVPDDGVRFNTDEIRGQLIKEDQEYEGVRVLIPARLGAARIRVQVDVGFGDVITPAALEAEIPTLLGEALNQSPLRLRVYNRETVIAEKFEAMVKLGTSNTRLKDFYDVWTLSQLPLDLAVLRASIRATFAHRGTPLPTLEVPVVLSAQQSDEPSQVTRWNAFCRKNGLSLTTTPAWPEITAQLRAFLLPLVREP